MRPGPLGAATMIKVKVRLNMKNHEAFRRSHAPRMLGLSGPYAEVWQQVPTLYTDYLRKLARRYSSGEGSPWPSISPRTAAAKGGSYRILWHTGYMIRCITMNSGAFMAMPVTGGVRITLTASGVSHPTAKMPVGRLMSIHHFGDSSINLPARPIVRTPDGELLGKVRRMLERAGKAYLRSLSRG
jgi:hypothetical protein